MPASEIAVAEPRRCRTRLIGFDYGRQGAYFVTICALYRQCVFGTIVDSQMRPRPLGAIVTECWREIPQHFPSATLDAFVLMPNHLHGILQLHADEGAVAAPLPIVIGSFKSAVTKRAGVGVWHRSYWDRIVRNEDELNSLRHYIAENPLYWSLDEYNLTRP